ncbi:hypothetical protein D3C80_1606090 [compost metagenome]
MHQHANGGRVVAFRHFETGEDFGQLFGTAGRVFSGDHPHFNPHAVSDLRLNGRFKRGDGFRFVIFDADQHAFRMQHMA